MVNLAHHVRNLNVKVLWWDVGLSVVKYSVLEWMIKTDSCFVQFTSELWESASIFLNSSFGLDDIFYSTMPFRMGQLVPYVQISACIFLGQGTVLLASLGSPRRVESVSIFFLRILFLRSPSDYLVASSTMESRTSFRCDLHHQYHTCFPCDWEFPLPFGEFFQKAQPTSQTLPC